MLGNRGLHLHSVGRCEHKIPCRIDQARGIPPMSGGIHRTAKHVHSRYVLDIHMFFEWT